MSYTRDWLDIPIDHSKFKNQPSAVRDVRIDVADRIKNLIYGFISGETTEGFKKIPLYVQTTAPSTVADFIILYGKDASSKCEVHIADEDGNVIQATSRGYLYLLKALLANNAYVLGRNAADDANLSLFKVNTAGDLELAPNLVLASDKAVNLGDPATDGSWRIVRDGNNIVFQRKESATWVAKNTITP